MRPIGGYFELETSAKSTFPHDDGRLVNSGRHALEYILVSLKRLPKRIWLPYYTCDVILEPLNRLNIPFSFYHIDKNLEIADKFDLTDDEYIIANNYFGVKDYYISQLANMFGNQLIIDCAQAFFMPYISDTNCFYSPRKFVGVPDGGIAYTHDNGNEMTFDQDYSFERCSHLLKRIDLGPSGGYDDFKANSSLLKNTSVKEMSILTKTLLKGLDYSAIKSKRKKNYAILSDYLDSMNQLVIPLADSFACPMVYPFMTPDLTIRKRLIDNKVFVAKYWPNIKDWCKPEDPEYDMAEQIIPLPIDQRYGDKEMEYIIDIIANGK